MSFKLFEIEFDGENDSFKEGNKKMDEVCKIIGSKFLYEWIDYGVEIDKVDRNNSNSIYKWIKFLEDVKLKDLKKWKVVNKKEIDGN